jgi:hypothetical protein
VGKRAKAPSDPEQHRRFVDASRELGCDESEERFAQVVRTVVTARKSSAPEIKAKVAKRTPEKG